MYHVLGAQSLKNCPGLPNPDGDAMETRRGSKSRTVLSVAEAMKTARRVITEALRGVLEQARVGPREQSYWNLGRAAALNN